MKQKTEFKDTEIGMIPEDWEKKNLGEEIELGYGKGLPKKNRIPGPYPVFGSNGIVGSHNDFLVEGPGIIIGRKGSVGEVKFSKNDFWPIDTTYYLKVKKKGSIDFWYYFLLTLKLNRMNSHSAVPGLNRDMVYELKKKIPDEKEQKSIAKILSDLDSKIELLQKQNKTLEAIGQAIFKHWFVDFEFPNEEGKPYKSSGGEMVFNEELGKEIPKWWVVKPIKELCKSISNGGTPRRMESAFWNGNINWYKTGELFDNPLLESEEKITEKGLNNSACKLWDENTILVALYASPTVGRLGILKTKATSNQACSGLIAKDEIGYPFLFYTLLSKRGYFNNLAVGAAQQNINAEIVKETKVIKPGSKVLDRFNLLTFNAFDKRTQLLKEVYILSQIRDSLLPKLMSGKIRVPVEEE